MPEGSHDRGRAATESDIIIDLDAGRRNDRLTRETLRRALERTNSTTGLEREPKYQRQPWYDRIPVATDVRFTATTPDGKTLDIRSNEARAPYLQEERMVRLDAVLLNQRGRTIRTLETDLALAGEEGEIAETRIYIAKDHDLTVERLVDALEGAFFEPYEQRTEAGERAAFQAEAEYTAAKLIEPREQEDLRQIIRAADNTLTHRIARNPYTEEDIRITLSGGGITAEIVNLTTKKVTTRSASYAELRNPKG